MIKLVLIITGISTILQIGLVANPIYNHVMHAAFAALNALAFGYLLAVTLGNAR